MNAASVPACRSRISAHARGLCVLAVLLEVPVARHLVTALTDEPRVSDERVAGTPALVARPGRGAGPWPALVFLNGATERGRHHPAVGGLARALARAGYVVIVPDVDGLTQGEISRRTLAATLTVVRAASGRRDARAGRVGLAGVSVGATLALLAAEDEHVADRVTVVAGIAPYTDLKRIVRLATTGHYGPEPFAAAPFLSLVIARSLVSGLPPGEDKRILRERLLSVDLSEGDPLRVIRELPGEQLRLAAASLAALLSNSDPERFDELYDRLPAPVRAGVARLSPSYGAARLVTRVELASPVKDKYFPLTESRELLARTRHGRLTVTDALEHAVPRLSLRGIADLLRFYGFVTRSLRYAND
jgi:dienelactone hydrolase